MNVRPHHDDDDNNDRGDGAAYDDSTRIMRLTMTMIMNLRPHHDHNDNNHDNDDDETDGEK